MVVQLQFPLAPEHVEEVYTGITLEWFLNRKVVAYKITAVSKTIVDRWASHALRILREWPEDQPYLALHDLSWPGVSLQYAVMVDFQTTNIGVTPAGWDQVARLIETRCGFQARVALNFNLSVSGHANKALADYRNEHRRLVRPIIEYRTFYDRSKSLTWLSAVLNTGDRLGPSGTEQ